ncbi:MULTISPECIES: dihydroxyacetone kinase subunit DhaL [unclassified Streptomyces]|uniref:dihydroxyacetone kinase subunit DhaL n=1 Tax=unclassified Streptomyces TaxID=2593676 RepID=UPI00136C8AC6|nr:MULTISPECIES: dihydroxyacetone kinase subunit DhaL [unclassified Streptomyces]MCW5254297.1 dihydroxyacetone kinase subunit L [Streptomyces sp. SHP 1-2]MYU25985.1 dihydroxyacetone kinase subunit L [Streptomyces sp. SID8352]
MMTSTLPDAFSGELWIRRFADSARATEPQLTSLDQQVGDGDFGTNLVLGTSAALARLGALTEPDDSAALDAAATAFLDEVGGTSGPLFGLLLQSLATAVAPSGATATALAVGVTDGLAAIRRVGDASPGDKTLVDALAPAAEALRTASGTSGTGPALADAARAAWRGVRETARLRASMGRSSYLGERAEGIPDPGAVGVALLFASASDVVRDIEPHLDGDRPGESPVQAAR